MFVLLVIIVIMEKLPMDYKKVAKFCRLPRTFNKARFKGNGKL